MTGDTLKARRWWPARQLMTRPQPQPRHGRAPLPLDRGILEYRLPLTLPGDRPRAGRHVLTKRQLSTRWREARLSVPPRRRPVCHEADA